MPFRSLIQCCGKAVWAVVLMLRNPAGQEGGLLEFGVTEGHLSIHQTLCVLCLQMENE